MKKHIPLLLTLSLVAAPVKAEEFSQMQQAETWVYNWMTKMVPLGAKSYYDDAQETPTERSKRYQEIARDIVAVVFDPTTRPVFQGAQGRMRTVSFIAAIMYHESSFLKHIDQGLGKYSRGDEGKSWCMMQVMTYAKDRTMSWNTKHDRRVRWNDPEEEISLGFTGPELIQDRRNCIRAGLRVIRVSFAAGSKRPFEERLAVYTSGKPDKGLSASRTRVRTALRMFAGTAEDRNGLKDQLIVSEVVPFLVAEKEALERQNRKVKAERAEVVETESPRPPES